MPFFIQCREIVDIVKEEMVTENNPRAFLLDLIISTFPEEIHARCNSLQGLPLKWIEKV